MSEYVSIKDAARILGVSDKRVYSYVENGRLPAVRAAHVIMIPLEEVQRFKPKIAGRPRKNTPLWRTSPADNVQLSTLIYVQTYTDRQQQLRQKLQAIKQAQEHIFPGTIARYVIGDTSRPGAVEILLIWRSPGIPGTTAREQALEAFRQALADVVDWTTAQYSEGEILLHA